MCPVNINTASERRPLSDGKEVHVENARVSPSPQKARLPHAGLMNLLDTNCTFAKSSFRKLDVSWLVWKKCASG